MKVWNRLKSPLHLRYAGRRMPMSAFFEAKSLTPDEQKRLTAEVEKRISEKLKDGTLTEKDVQGIEEMRLKPLPDIQDVQNVYEDHLFRKDHD
jgi:hypothetical protein